MSTTKKTSSKKSPEELIRLLKPIASAGDVLLQEMEKAKLKNPFFFVGEQELRIKRTIEWIKQNLFNGKNSSISTYFADDLASQSGANNLIASLTNLSLFCSLQLVIIYNADRVKAATAKRIAEAIKKAASSIIILTGQSLNQKAALFAALSTEGTIVEFGELSPALLKKWIEKEAQQSGDIDGIEQDALELLIRCYGADLTSLSKEISKLSLLTPIGGRISKKLVQALSLKSPEATNFALFNAIARKDCLTSERLVNDLLEQGLHPLQISAFLSRCVRALLASENSSGQEISSELQNQWFMKNLAPTKRLFTPPALVESLDLLKRLDFQLKDSTLPDKLTLPLAVQKISTRKTNSSRPSQYR